PQHGGAHVDLAALAELLREALSHPAQAFGAPQIAIGKINGLSASRPGALGHDNNAELGPAPAAVFDLGADGIQVVGNLGDQDDIGPAGNPGFQGDPAGVAANQLDHHHPVVTLGGGVQAVNGFHSCV